MKDLTVGDLFRYSIPGGIFLLTLHAADPTLLLGRSGERTLFDATILVALALVFGSLIQSVHRAVFFVFAQRVMLRMLLPKSERPSRFREVWVLWPTKPELDSYRAHLDAGAKEVNSHRHKWLARWADQTHLLWASFWALLIGRYAPDLAHIARSTSYDDVICLGMAILLVAAVVDTPRQARFSWEFYDRHK